MKWAEHKWWNPFAVAPLMRQARHHGLSPEAAAAAVEQPSDEEMAEVAKTVDAWMARRVKEGLPPAPMRLLWLVLFKCNRGRAVQLGILAVFFITFRIANSFVFTIFMAVLADSPADLVGLTFMPSAALATALYASVAVFASVFNYLMDQASKELGTRIKMQVREWIFCRSLQHREPSVACAVTPPH